jgi:hypothetical protein
MPAALTRIGILAVVILVSSGPLEAQVIPGRWEKLDATLAGTAVIVRLQTNMNIEGKFQGSTGDEVTVVTDTGVMQVAKANIREITTAAVSADSLKNGALIGSGIGLGIALGLLAVAGSGEGYVLESAKWAGPLFGFGAGLGAGVAIDAARKQREVLYRVR